MGRSFGFKAVKDLFSKTPKPAPEQPSVRPDPPVDLPPPPEPTIDWSDPKCKISKHFTVHEALWLPSWKQHHIPTEEEKANILETAKAMDKIRDLVGSPITVSCWIRPTKANIPGNPNHGQDYNAFVKGAKFSAHRIGKAVDWVCMGKNCDDLRNLLLPKLEEFGICMEDLPGSVWVHIDIMPPRGTGRFFKP